MYAAMSRVKEAKHDLIDIPETPEKKENGFRQRQQQ